MYILYSFQLDPPARLGIESVIIYAVLGYLVYVSVLRVRFFIGPKIKKCAGVGNPSELAFCFGDFELCSASPLGFRVLGLGVCSSCGISRLECKSVTISKFEDELCPFQMCGRGGENHSRHF